MERLMFRAVVQLKTIVQNYYYYHYYYYYYYYYYYSSFLLLNMFCKIQTPSPLRRAHDYAGFFPAGASPQHVFRQVRVRSPYDPAYKS